MMDLQYPREPEEPAPRPRLVLGRLKRALVRLGAVSVKIARTLIATPFRRRGAEAIEDVTPARRLLRGVAYRMLFAPILLTLIASLLVYVATHPKSLAGDLDPISVGVYYDPVTFVASDGVRLDAWLAPALDARKVIADRERALRQRSPGVVLVHDMGQTARQMLPLVRPLHEAGYVVLVVGVRGSGGAEPVGQTFGLNESLDVQAAVDMLRRRHFVDPKRVAVIGVGTGATAALLAKESGADIAALVLIDLPTDTTKLVGRAMALRSPALNWLVPICRWTFEVAYQVSLSDLETSRAIARADPRRLLQVSGGVSDGLAMSPPRVKPITDFLQGVFGRNRTNTSARVP